jgi:hypothetical protein
MGITCTRVFLAILLVVSLLSADAKCGNGLLTPQQCVLLVRTRCSGITESSAVAAKQR